MSDPIDPDVVFQAQAQASASLLVHALLEEEDRSRLVLYPVTLDGEQMMAVGIEKDAATIKPLALLMTPALFTRTRCAGARIVDSDTGIFLDEDNNLCLPVPPPSPSASALPPRPPPPAPPVA